MNFIPGPVGQLEAIVNPSKQLHQLGVAVVCHPHALFEGTMNNKVVTTIVKTFNKLNITTIRFNFRGVGKSEGSYGNAVGELEDVLSVIRWVEQHYSNQPLYLAGFSFGAYIAASAASNVEVKQLILVAPPVHNFNFSILPEFECPWVVVQGEQDEVVPAEEVFKWIHSRRQAPEIIK